MHLYKNGHHIKEIIFHEGKMWTCSSCQDLLVISQSFLSSSLCLSRHCLSLLYMLQESDWEGWQSQEWQQVHPLQDKWYCLKIHPRRLSFLDNIKGELCTFVLITRQKGIQVSTHMVHQEASCLLPAFRVKPLDAQKKAVLCFTKRVRLSYWVGTHTTAQKNFQETEEESRHFIEFIKDKVALKDPERISSTRIRPQFHFHFMLTGPSRKGIENDPHLHINSRHKASYTCCDHWYKQKGVATLPCL